ncbi:hypothetical protein TSUD_154800 [Trifolium subterraneum]|uniref:Uncharacterized protein n=1 Tax=Trifolium subterraneum TaxID=3900 RepID=A0A2Z6N703_TRISU|nr:hypothetical protein TSUD_154800 [Trifolium subterraneum]
MIEDRKGKRSTCGEEPLQEPSQMGKAVAVMRHPPLYACRYLSKGYVNSFKFKQVIVANPELKRDVTPIKICYVFK